MDSFNCDTDFYYHVVSLMSPPAFEHFLVVIATAYSFLFREPVILRCVKIPQALPVRVRKIEGSDGKLGGAWERG